MLLADAKPVTQRHAACALWGLSDGKDGVYDKQIAEARSQGHTRTRTAIHPPTELSAQSARTDSNVRIVTCDVRCRRAPSRT